MRYYRNAAVFALLLVLGVLQGTTAKSTGEVEKTASEFGTVTGVVLLVCLIVALALCGGSAVAPKIPLPAWVTIIQIDPAIDQGIGGCSDGMNIINPNTVHRHRTGHFETDGAKWGVALSKGKHVFEIYWPSGQRGSLATVGVGSEHAPLFVKPRDSLVGCNGESWGFDIARRKILHKGQLLGSLPKAGFVPDKFYMYVDCDSGTVGFGSEVEYWGAPLSVPKAKFPIYPMIGCLCANAQVTMIYRGSENRAMVGQPQVLNTVVVPSQMPGGAGMQYVAVNPEVVQMQQQPQQPQQPPQYEQKDPSMNPGLPPPSYEEQKGE